MKPGPIPGSFSLPVIARTSPGVTAERSRRLHQGSPGVRDSNEAKDAFG
ncbi:hypothetical protein [Streptomyces zagrosensis]|uniref:Uncharacterized protein n=1 Tax=Streptomyces zagrosensis TaxID=1042984 RepID=A0A7W9QCT3_9ACTN|nr:hypothetical protein [Streptomyces zagrosensis]MBB5937746.1 hypothetical protein [Streptomyces zagrosensis]